MKTYKAFTDELDEVLGLSARKQLGRRMKILAKKASTKMRKKMNKMRALTQDKAKKKAQKKVRKFFMQKMAGKSKDLKSMSMQQKANLEKRVDQKMKKAAGAVHSMVSRFKKKVIKKHNQDRQAAHDNMLDKHHDRHK